MTGIVIFKAYSSRRVFHSTFFGLNLRVAEKSYEWPTFPEKWTNFEFSFNFLLKYVILYVIDVSCRRCDDDVGTIWVCMAVVPPCFISGQGNLRVIFVDKSIFESHFIWRSHLRARVLALPMGDERIWVSPYAFAAPSCEALPDITVGARRPLTYSIITEMNLRVFNIVIEGPAIYSVQHSPLGKFKKIFHRSKV